MNSNHAARVLIFGASGQVGRALQNSAPSWSTIFTPTSLKVDFRNQHALQTAIRERAPDIIINCAAFTRVDDAQSDSNTAREINAEAPQILAEECARLSARLIHVSTDYVFDGSGSPPYLPTDSPAPLNVYGTTKLAGENAVLNANTNAAVVRTSWVHSGGGVNFIATAVDALRRGDTLRVVDDQVSTPTRAAHLASALWSLARQSDALGLLHFSDAGVASWYDVAHSVLETLQHANAAGHGAAVLPVASNESPRPARRPRVSLLDKHSSWGILGLASPHWRIGVMASTHELLNE